MKNIKVVDLQCKTILCQAIEQKLNDISECLSLSRPFLSKIFDFLYAIVLFSGIEFIKHNKRTTFVFISLSDIFEIKDTSDEEYTMYLANIMLKKQTETLREEKRQPFKRKLLEESEESIDDSDATYIPNVKDVDSSDSETHDTLGLQRQTSEDPQRKEFDSLKVRKKYQQIVRQKNWMKTPTRIRKAKKIAIRVVNSHTKFIADKLCKRLKELQNSRKSKKKKH